MLKVVRGVLILTSILFVCSFLFAQATQSTHKHDGAAVSCCDGDNKCCKGGCKRDAAGKCTDDCCKKHGAGKGGCCNGGSCAGKDGKEGCGSGCCGGKSETASAGASCSRKGGKCCGGMAGK
ncbi:MAG TPA: hypothetical protein VD837_03145 [Terriglobales bacterium]|nr:hypothetical protein [Terriglobales bacterium]